MNQHHILIVEDDDALRELLAKELSDAGFLVSNTRKIPEALQMLSQKKFHCIILDMQLDTGSGERVVSAIRGEKDGVNFHTPVIVVSGSLHPPLVNRLGNDIQGMVAKPFSMNALFEKVAEFIPTPAAKPVQKKDKILGRSASVPQLQYALGTEIKFLEHLLLPIQSVVHIQNSLINRLNEKGDHLASEMIDMEKALTLIDEIRLMLLARKEHLEDKSLKRPI